MSPTRNSLTCGVYLDHDTPCAVAAVETLIFCNPLCGGWGFLHVCREHLTEYRNESLL